MKRFVATIILAILCVTTTVAQRLFQTEISREAVLAADSTNYISFRPTSSNVFGDPDPHLAIDHYLDVPSSWGGKRLYLHLESVGMGYKLRVNGEDIAQCDDPYTPAEYEITRALDDVFNIITLEMGRSSSTELNTGLERGETPQRGRFDNSYYFTRESVDVMDFDATIRPDENMEYALLSLSAVVENSTSTPQQISVGYYLETPSGAVVSSKLEPIDIAEMSRDTIHFSRRIRSYESYMWSASNPKLYRLTMVTSRDRVVRKLPTRAVAYRDGVMPRDTLYATRYNATKSKTVSFGELDSLKAAGYNTILPDYPQPMWFYDYCTEVGLYVVDQANIHASEGHDNRAIGGTPSNNPSFLAEYIERVKGCYMRSRNNPSVIGYSLGGESGNGYTMYKTYEWLKSVEQERPIIYIGAEGEWNSDDLEFRADEY